MIKIDTPVPNTDECRYTYVLRLWRDDAQMPWRLALREANDTAFTGLADLDELVIVLLRQMGEPHNLRTCR